LARDPARLRRATRLRSASVLAATLAPWDPQPAGAAPLPCRGRVAPPATDYPRPCAPALPAGQKARPPRPVVKSRPMRASCALLALALAAAVSAQAPAANPKIPTPASVLGHTPGDDFYLASYDDALGYYRKLAASSDRIKLVNVGKTTRGLDFYLALISSPENLAQLDHYKDVNRRLTWARGLDDAGAHALAREGKIFVHVDGGMHSTEVAGAQQSVTLAYKLVSSQNDPEVDAILHNDILVLWPTLNPDGQNEVVAWYRKNLGTRFEVSPLPDLYQEYVGHDNNRDGYMNNMLESQEITRQELDWNPEIFYTHHQT